MTVLRSKIQLRKQAKTYKYAGFTLVELLVTISMMAIITAGIFGYSRNNENQNNLNRAEQRLVFELGRVETLAMNNSQDSGNTLEGKWIRWGIVFDNNGTSYDVKAQTCDSEAVPGGPFSNDKGLCSSHNNPVTIETVRLPTGINISASGTTSVYFLAPEPAVYNDNQRIMGDAKILVVLTLQSSGKTRTVEINSIGQINGD